MYIQLSDGVNSDPFRTNDPDCPIIFITAYNEYAIRALRVNSNDYLLKPVDRNDMEAALLKFHRLQKHLPKEDLRTQLEILMKDSQ